MRGLLLKHEWRSLWADGSVWLTVGVFALAIGYGAASGSGWVASQRTAIDLARNEERERHQRHTAEIARINREHATVSAFADPRNPDAAGRSMSARYAVLPPMPLAALSVGQSDLSPSFLKITTDAKETVLAATAIENPHRILAGRFDPAFVLVYLYPLLILGMTYNLLSSEKEQGTLLLALSQPVSLPALLGGKLLLRLLVCAAAVIVFAVILLSAAGVDLTATGASALFVLWVLAAVLYGAFWFCTAAWIASLGRASAVNATMLAGIWFGLVVLVPFVISTAVTAVYPVPSRVEMVQAARVASDDANAEGSALLARYYEDHPELASGDAEQAMNDFNLVRVAVAAEVEQRVRPVRDRFDDQLAAQQRIVDRFRYLSPAILMQDALNDIAGTGTARYRNFLGQVGIFHEEWRQYFVRLIFAKAQLDSYESVPRFVLREESLPTTARRVAVSLAGLALPAVAFAVFAVRRLRRYPIV